ncbi:MAG: glutamate-5-semialdehyde dehydrogenase [Cyanobacteria bacterium P01_E01_bin.42]
MTREDNDTQTLISPILRQADRAAQELAAAPGNQRSQAIANLARALDLARADILEANTLDLETSRDMAIPESLREWLKLTPERLQKAIQILQRLSELADPIFQVRQTSHPVESAQTYYQSVPLGVVALIYEAFPELGAIAAGFCLKTGNALILRGSSEASHTNAAIAGALQEAIAESELPSGCIAAIAPEQGSSIQDLLAYNQHLNLVIPYGRASLVQKVSQWSTIPVLPAAIGNCYLYCSPSGDLDVVREMILDSHASEPDPVNAIEKVLICRGGNFSSLMRLFANLQEKGFELRGDREMSETFPEALKPAGESEWGRAYLKKIVAFKIVDDMDDAIAWIERYSSGHADCLVTESYRESQQFARGVNSALVYINSSPRFFRYPQRSDTVFLGISNQKGLRRGLMGLASLTTLKQVVQGWGF